MALLGKNKKTEKTEPRASATKIQIFPSYTIH